MDQAAIKSSKWKTPKHVVRRALTLAESADICLCAKQKVGRDMQTFGLIMYKNWNRYSVFVRIGGFQVGSQPQHA